MNELTEYAVENPELAMDAAQIPLSAGLGAALGYMEESVEMQRGNSESYGRIANTIGGISSTVGEISEEYLSPGGEGAFGSAEQTADTVEGATTALVSFLGGKEAGKRYARKRNDF